ncbi:hypothetical protein GGS26DRAFT_473913 [Hypomontagnella submonticulosa]|nr:hypothetical protein GGS26DRAFT_473913 [Hypomontagnella submonticulosa]
MGPKRKSQEEKGETSSKSPSKQRKASGGEKGGSSSRSQNTDLHHGFESYPPSKVYRLIEPGPVLMVTTGSLADATHNVMTIGFHMVMQHESPPLIGICLGPWDASFAALKRQRECVLAVPAVEMAGVVVDIGNCSADDEVDGNDGGGEATTNKWQRFGLEAVPAARVKAPLVGGNDVIANIECVVEDTKMVSKYSMWVLKPVKAWINPNKKPGEGGRMFHHRGDGTFVVDGEIVDLKDRMVKWQEYQD